MNETHVVDGASLAVALWLLAGVSSMGCDGGESPPSRDPARLQDIADESRLPDLVETGEPDALTVAMAERLEAELTAEQLDALLDIDWEITDAEVLGDPVFRRALGISASVIDAYVAGEEELGSSSDPLVTQACLDATSVAIDAVKRVIRHLASTAGSDWRLRLVCGAVIYGAPAIPAAVTAGGLCIASLYILYWGATPEVVSGVQSAREAFSRLDSLCDPSHCGGRAGDPCCAEFPRCDVGTGLTCDGEICVPDGPPVEEDGGVPADAGGPEDAGAPCGTTVDMMQTDGTEECCRIQGGFRQVTLSPATTTRPSTWSVQGSVDLDVVLDRVTAPYCPRLVGVIGTTRFGLSVDTLVPEPSENAGYPVTGSDAGGSL